MKRLLLLMLLGLGGCEGSPVGNMIAGPEKLAQQDDAYCQSIGTRYGTPEYSNCRLVTAQQRDQRDAARLANSAALIAAGAQMRAAAAEQTPPPPLQPMQIPAPVRCRSMQVGITVQTVCQ
jgi:hypothetical protein